MTSDSFTGSRYAFTGGNPAGNIELDGHKPCGSTEDCQQYDRYLHDTGQYYSASAGTEQPQTPVMRQKQAEYQEQVKQGRRVDFPGGTVYERTENQTFINGVELPVIGSSPDLEVLAEQLDNWVRNRDAWKKTAQRQAEQNMLGMGSLNQEATLHALQSIVAESGNREYLLEISSDQLLESLAGEGAGIAVGAAGAKGLKRAFGSGKPPHVANVSVTDANGNVILKRQFTSGNMTAEEKSLGFTRSSLATHTENRAVRGIQLSPGQAMRIEGQYAPCPSCKGAMNQAARDSGATIEYVWPGGSWTAGR